MSGSTLREGNERANGEARPTPRAAGAWRHLLVGGLTVAAIAVMSLIFAIAPLMAVGVRMRVAAIGLLVSTGALGLACTLAYPAVRIGPALARPELPLWVRLVARHRVATGIGFLLGAIAYSTLGMGLMMVLWPASLWAGVILGSRLGRRDRCP